jgi:hypothetical protein
MQLLPGRKDLQHLDEQELKRFPVTSVYWNSKEKDMYYHSGSALVPNPLYQTQELRSSRFYKPITLFHV